MLDGKCWSNVMFGMAILLMQVQNQEAPGLGWWFVVTWCPLLAGLQCNQVAPKLVKDPKPQLWRLHNPTAAVWGNKPADLRRANTSYLDLGGTSYFYVHGAFYGEVVTLVASVLHCGKRCYAVHPPAWDYIMRNGVMGST